jgi:AcrR family transcriptional regulator
VAEKQRRTQAERSAATRRALLDASIRCLYENGYGATTTILVAKMAGVSRGAMLHQFPSKSDLMIYVVEAVHEETVQLYGTLLAGIDEPRDRLLAYPRAVWEVESRPAGVAVLEILQGSRSDKELAEKLRPVEARLEQEALEHLKTEFPRPSPAMLHLIVATVQGLSVTQMLKPERDSTEAIELLRTLLQAGVDAGVAGSTERSAKARKKTA